MKTISKVKKLASSVSEIRVLRPAELARVIGGTASLSDSSSRPVGGPHVKVFSGTQTPILL